MGAPFGPTVEGEAAAAGDKYFPISFPIPLAAEPEAIVVEPNEESKPGCPGRGGGSFPPSGQYRPTIPMADPGKLCVYIDALSEASLGGFRVSSFEEGIWGLASGVSQSGTLFSVFCETKFCQVFGSWAVTG